MNLEGCLEIVRIKPTSYVYNRKQMIGKGSFGQVYMGYNEKEHTPVAVKIISFEKISKKQSKENLMSKLKQEIINMQIAQDENVVQLFDAQSSSRNLYIVCEYCNGESFDSFLKRKGYLTENQALNFFKQILCGFQNLHTKKIVHRDLKPANLLMHNYSIKLADLGFSKAIDQHSQLLQSIVGTPLYMSPQIFSNQKYTQKTDIWSLGVILYEMLYGKIPWKGQTLMELEEKVWNQTLEFPSVPFTTLTTKQLIRNMLQRKENNRIGWQELFSSYISFQEVTSQTSYSNMSIIQQKREYIESFARLFEYINKSFYLQSEYQLIRVLIDLDIRKKKQIEGDSIFESAEQFFEYKLFVDSRKVQILSYCFNYFTIRNKISYLFKIFEHLHQLIDSIENHPNETISTFIGTLISCQFLIIKFSIHSIFKLQNKDPSNYEQTKILKPFQSGITHYHKYVRMLLQHDFRTFNQFLQIFMTQYFNNKIKNLATCKPQLVVHLNKQLGGLYKNQIGDLKFVEFMLANSLRSVFNEVKNIEPKTNLELILTRMIHELEKDKKLFDLNDVLELYNPRLNKTMPIVNTHDLHKKLNQWRGDDKWKEKLVQLSDMKIQTLNSYINKQFKWNPLQIYSDLIK